MTEQAGRAVPRSAKDLEALVGRELGPTNWVEVGQPRVDAFAEITGDRQWIHVDVERAAAGPMGGTIGHGLLTLALGPTFTEELFSFEGFALTLNYGYEKVRFPAPTPVGSRVRMTATVTDVRRVQGGAQVTTTQVFTVEGSAKPVCVAESVGRFVEHPS